MAEENSIQLVTNLVRNAAVLDNKIDELLNPYKDYTDTLGDIVLPLKITISTLNIARLRKFKSFLKGFANMVDSDNVNEQYIRKIENYLSKEMNLDFIAETVDSAIEAKSTKCSAILGYFAGTILLGLDDIQYKDTTIVNALKIMNNIDISHFFKIYKKFYNPQVVKRSFRVSMDEQFSDLGIDTFELESTIEKLKAVQVLGYDSGGLGNVGNAWGAFRFNDNSTYLSEIISKSKMMEIL
ncbi:hypothetical protein [Peribacillus sp. SCS-37]|uniref:hypothetical protein n=1 Tax=Paraperibacillus esterisolvens TaxID=3115296 RepID=UPI00390672DA